MLGHAVEDERRNTFEFYSFVVRHQRPRNFEKKIPRQPDLLPEIDSSACIIEGRGTRRTMEYRRQRQTRERDEFFRASSNTPVRLLAEAECNAQARTFEDERDGQARLIEELRNELDDVKAREQQLERRLRELEAIHKADVALLLEESQRTSNALLCIRGLCDYQQTSEREESPCAGDLLAALISEAGIEACGTEVGEVDEADERTVVHEVIGGEIEEDGGGNGGNGGDDAGGDSGDRGTDDGDVASASVGDSVDLDSPYSVSDRSVIYSRQDDEVCIKESFCQIREYRGENPGVLTENNMDRILDHPKSTSMSKGNTANKLHSPNPRCGPGNDQLGSCNELGLGQGTDPDSPTAWKIPSVHTRTRLLVEELERKLRSRQAAIDRKDISFGVTWKDNAGDGVDTGGAHGDKALSDPRLGLEGEDEFVRTIRALGDSSPTTANLLTQHVSDSWVQKYARKSSSAPGGMAAGKPGGASIRSSFLKRSPISLAEVFSSGSTSWATRAAG